MMGNTPRPRDVIYSNLLRTYHPKATSLNWYNGGSERFEMVRDLTTNILDTLVRSYVSDNPYYREDVFGDVRNAIWMVYAGGGTAENCARRIFADLGIEVKADE